MEENESNGRTLVQELLFEAETLPVGPSQIALYEEAVRIADAQCTSDFAYTVRMDAIDAAMRGGRPELLLIHFAWCLSHFDKKPDEFDSYSLLWKYKWVINACREFPSISRTKILELIADFSRRLEIDGSSQHPALLCEFQTAEGMGRFEEAAALYEKFQATPRSYLSDCRACVSDREVRWALMQNDVATAQSRCQALLKSKMFCLHVPMSTYTRMLLPSIQLGDWEQAAKFHAKSYRQVSQNPEFLYQLGSHVGYLTLVGNKNAALRAIRIGCRFWGDSSSLDGRWNFAWNVDLFLTRMRERLEKWITLIPPDEFNIAVEKRKCDVASLHHAVHEYLDRVGSRFDARNGTHWFAEKRSTIPEWIERALPLNEE